MSFTVMFLTLFICFFKLFNDSTWEEAVGTNTGELALWHHRGFENDKLRKLYKINVSSFSEQTISLVSRVTVALVHQVQLQCYLIGYS